MGAASTLAAPVPVPAALLTSDHGSELEFSGAAWWSRSTNKATLNAAKATTAETVAAALETNRATIEAAHADVRNALDTTREGQLADRYTKAIEQLGSSKLDGRIGGIYALQLVARASPREHSAVMNVLAAFVRERSHERWPEKVAGAAESLQQTARPDVLAAISVISQRDPKNDPTALDLTSAVFEDVDLKRANLSGVNLRNANFIDADLTGADLTVTKLTRATLIRAKLDSFTYNEELSGPYLTDADLTEARWPLKAWTPEGWVRDTDSGLLKPADAAPGDAR